MPRIPIITAQQGPGVLQLPAVQRQNGFEAVSRLGEQMATIQGRIQNQQDELDLFRTLTDTETELKQRQMDVSVDTDYATQAERFQKSAKEVMFRKLGTLRSPSVAAVYQSRAERMIAEAGIHVETNAAKQRLEGQKADWITVGAQASALWADAATPEKQEMIRSEYFDGISRNGAFDDKDRTKAGAQFYESAMEYLRLTNRPRMRGMDSQGAFQSIDPLKRAEILQKARQDDARDQANERENHNRAKDSYVGSKWALANQGLLPQSWLEEAKKGLDPFFVNPKDIDDLEERNLNPIVGAGSQQVQAIMLEYARGDAAPARIQRARKQLNALTDAPQGAVRKALEKLQGIESARSNSALQAGFDAIKREFEAEEQPFLPGRMGEMQKFKRRQQLGQAERKLGEGQPLEQIIKERRERRRLEEEQRKQRQSQTDDDVNTILKGVGPQ